MLPIIPKTVSNFCEECDHVLRSYRFRRRELAWAKRTDDYYITKHRTTVHSSEQLLILPRPISQKEPGKIIVARFAFQGPGCVGPENEPHTPGQIIGGSC